MSKNTHQELKEGSIVEKGFEIDLDKLEEGYLSDVIICQAESLGKAKAKLLRKVQYDDWRLKYSGEELTYLNIPVKRKKSCDKVIFEGKEVLRISIDSIILERERIAKLDEIINDKNTTH